MLRMRRIGSIAGLSDALNAKLPLSSIKGTIDDVVNANNINTVPSTQAIVQLKSNIETSITNVQNSIVGIIDDTLEAGNENTWSVDKIKSYVASVDDSVVVSSLSERDELEAYGSLIAYVLDTTGDTSLGNEEGTAAAYIYVDGEGWKILQILKGDIDLTPYVKKTDVVDSLDSEATDLPLSANQGKQLAQAIAESAASVNTEIFVDSGLDIDSDKFVTTSTPIGNIVGAYAEVNNGDGTWDIVDITPTENAKEYQLVIDNSGEYDGKTCRVTYLRNVSGN